MGHKPGVGRPDEGIELFEERIHGFPGSGCVTAYPAVTFSSSIPYVFDVDDATFVANSSGCWDSVVPCGGITPERGWRLGNHKSQSAHFERAGRTALSGPRRQAFVAG